MKRYSGPVPKSGPKPPAKRRPLPRASHKRLSEREQRADVRRLTIERAVLADRLGIDVMETAS